MPLRANPGSGCGGWIWGIDCDVRGAHFGFVAFNSGTFQTNAVIWDDLEDPGRRLIECRQHVKQFATAVQRDFPPSMIAVERPVGRFHKPPLMMHTGVIAEAIGAATGLAPFFLSTKEWRKLLGLPGGGNATKDAVVEWARSRGWAHGPVDQAEALGVAFAARSVWSDGLKAAA